MQSDLFQRSVSEARKEFEQKENMKLGDVTAVKQQIVSGINFKITFASPNGPYDIVVYAQPWTDTYKVTHVEKHNTPSGK